MKCKTCSATEGEMLYATFIPERLKNALELYKGHMCYECADVVLGSLYGRFEAPCSGMYFGCPNVATLKLSDAAHRESLPGCPKWCETAYVCGRCYQQARNISLRSEERKNDDEPKAKITKTASKLIDLEFLCQNSFSGCTFVKASGIAVQVLYRHEKICPYRSMDSMLPDDDDEPAGGDGGKLVPSRQLVNQQDNEGMTALHHAARENNTECLAVLLDMQHIMVDVRDKKGRTALDIARSEGNRKSVKLLKPRSNTKR